MTLETKNPGHAGVRPLEVRRLVRPSPRRFQEAEECLTEGSCSG
jgi:hypothetical protein